MVAFELTEVGQFTLQTRRVWNDRHYHTLDRFSVFRQLRCRKPIPMVSGQIIKSRLTQLPEIRGGQFWRCVLVEEPFFQLFDWGFAAASYLGSYFGGTICADYAEEVLDGGRVRWWGPGDYFVAVGLQGHDDGI